MILSLLIGCLISFVGAGKSILSSKNIPKKNTIKIKKTLITRLRFTKFLLALGFNLSCIISNLYLNSENKT